MFAVIMLILNGLVGGCMLFGSWKRGEQRFNADSASAYLPLVIALGTITLVLPRFCDSTIGGYMSDPMELFIAAGSIVVYGAFLWMQVSRYRGYFAAPDAGGASMTHHQGKVHVPSALALLFTALTVVVVCAEAMAGRVQPLRHRSKIAADLAAALLAIPPLRDNSAFRHPQAAHAAPTTAQGARRAGGWLTPAGSPQVARAGQWCSATQALQRSASLLRSRASAAACAVACAAVKQERVLQNLKDSDLEDGA